MSTILERVRSSSAASLPWRTGGLALMALLCASVLGGCASGSAGDNPFDEGGQGEERSVRIEVQNRNFNDATLYALSDGRRQRMGTVTGNSSGSVSISWPGDRTLRIEIDLLAGGDYTTPSVLVSPGERLQLVIQPNLRRSYIQR